LESLRAKQSKPAPLKWLDQMPPELANNGGGEYSAGVTLTLDTHAWLVYARAARKRGETIEEVLNCVLRSEDCGFEERGYMTRLEYDDHRAAQQKAVK
jgi:hypothetical protein